MPKAKNQKQGSASLVEMDARTLLRLINTGALAQHKIFDDKIRHLGREHGLNYQLVTLNQNSLVFEDADTGIRYKADIHRLDKGRYKFDNIQELKIVDNQKKGSFEKACLDLVESISEDDQKNADSVFHRIARQRFRPGVIPESGFVTTRDGISRYVHVHEDTVPEEAKPFIIKKICESLKDHVVVYNGQIVEATFSDGEEKLRIPITELIRRKVLCRHMRESAKKAYKSEGFQNRISAAASNYNDGKAMEAAKLLVPFVKENQEFSVLTFEETSELVSNALAATGCFNESTGAVIGKMLYKSSCQVNRTEIIESWRKAAQKAESAALLQNTRILAERKDFEEAYTEFLQMVFAEDSGTKSVRAQSYLNSLKDIRKVVEGTDEEGIMSALDDFIMKLEMDPEQIDDATLYEIEDLLASISQELIQDVRSLSDYDEIPESPEMEPSPTFGEKDLSGEPGAGGPAVPLPLGGIDDLGIDGETGAEGEEELELSPELGGAEPSGEALPLAADVNKDASPISEHSVIGDKNISEMDEDELKKELVEWTKNSVKFFSESGFDSCSKHIDNYVDRAIGLKNDELVESFQKILSDVLLAEQGESDPYAFTSEDMTPISENKTCSECGESMTTAECESGSKCGKCGGKMKSEATGEYGGTGLEMGGQDGKGVADKTAKKSDGKTSDKSAGKGGIAKESFEDRLNAAVHEATGEYSGTGLEMGGQDGKGVATQGLKKVSGTDASSGPGGSANTDSMDDQGGEGVAGSSASKSDGKSSGQSAGSSAGRDDSDKSAGKGSAKTPSKYDGTGTDMGGQDGKGVAKQDSSESDGVSSDKSAGKGGTVDEDVDIEEALECGCKVGGCKDNKDCDCAGSCPCKSGKVDEDQYKDPTRRRRMNPRRASLMQTEDIELDSAISAIADTIATDDDIAEGGLPPALEKWKKKKGGGKKGDDDSDDSDDSDGDSDDDEGGDDDSGGSSNKGGETGGNPFANEDKDITTPGKSGYDTEDDSRKDGDGKKRRPLPKFSDSDYDGSSGAKTADQAGDSGYSS